MHFTEGEISILWDDFFRHGGYHTALLEVNDKYPFERSIYVSFEDIVMYNSEFAWDIIKNPEMYLSEGEKVIKRHLNTDHNIHLRINKIPESERSEIKSLRTSHIGRFVAIRGIVVRATGVHPRLKIGAFKCSECGGVNYVEQEGKCIHLPEKCEICGKTRDKSKFILISEDSVFEDIQHAEIASEDMDTSNRIHKISVVLSDDIAGTLGPGERVVINGILKTIPIKIQSSTSTEFSMYIKIISVEKDEEDTVIEITEEDIEKIKKLATAKNVIDILKKSIAPTIYGMDTIKEALLLQMFGGVDKTTPDGSKIRGNIHVLLVGESGTAKSQLLQKISEIMPRGVYISGADSSSERLGPKVLRSETGEWAIEAGMLALADLGLTIIDGIDKLSPRDRDLISEVMDSRIIYISKGDVYASLKARCAVLCAATPKFGRFNIQTPLLSQIALPFLLLSRFDVIFKILDTYEPAKDDAIAEHILKMHKVRERSVNEGGNEEISHMVGDIVPQELIHKYVVYAKLMYSPKMSEEAHKKIKEEYLKLRRIYSETQQVTVTPRQLESMIRLAEASARARLSHMIMEEDAERAIQIIEKSMKDLS